jgi:hypothetical protein
MESLKKNIIRKNLPSFNVSSTLEVLNSLFIAKFLQGAESLMHASSVLSLENCYPFSGGVPYPNVRSLINYIFKVVFEAGLKA